MTVTVTLKHETLSKARKQALQNPDLLSGCIRVVKTNEIKKEQKNSLCAPVWVCDQHQSIQAVDCVRHAHWVDLTAAAISWARALLLTHKVPCVRVVYLVITASFRQTV